jgi:hypothetical protein
VVLVEQEVLHPPVLEQQNLTVAMEAEAKEGQQRKEDLEVHPEELAAMELTPLLPGQPLLPRPDLVGLAKVETVEA